MIDAFIAKMDSLFIRKKIPVLMYHRVADGGNLAVSLKNFDRQMEILCARGFRTIDFTELKKILINDEIPQGKLMIVTFDDGYKDNFTNAKDILEKFAFKAAVFVATEYIGGFSKFCTKSEDRGYPMMNADELRALESSGWDVANHFHSHQPLTKLSKQQLFEEIKKSQSILDGIIDKKENLYRFSLPKELVNQEIRDFLIAEGADMVFSGKGICRSGTQLSSIPRTEIFNYSDENKLVSRLSPVYYTLLRIRGF